MVIGAHVSSSGGVTNALVKADKLGVKALQTFLSAPQSYRVGDITDDVAHSFLAKKAELGIEKCFAHAIYLLNFASDVPKNIFLSKQNLIQTLNISAKLKFDGVIIHIGSTKDSVENGIKAVADNLREILDNTDPSSTLYLENSAGAGNHIGSSFDHIVEIINQNKGNSRIKVCLDTQHMFAAGYNIKDNPAKVLDEIFSKLGEKFELLHLNDSKMEFNSKKDRHENIGEGLIGYESLKIFCNDTRLNTLPCVLEVPGFENNGPDIKNVEVVRSFFK